MEFIAFTVAGIIIYVVSDHLLDRIEIMAGRRFQYRAVIFFFIILTLAVGGFALIRAIATDHM